MKKLTKLCAIALAAVSAASLPLSLTGCGEDKDDPNVLNIVGLNAGYGDTWIKKLAAKFEEDHPGYRVNLENFIYNVKPIISSHMGGGKNHDDLYICVGNDWKVYAAQRKFASLDDLLDETVDGVKVKDKVAPEYAQSIYFPDKDGDLHTYRLPWTAGVGGIYYNKAMFDENGWEIPTTYAELKDLCDTIVDAALPVESSSGRAQTVKPFIYTGANIDYFDYVVYTWWAQLSGEDSIGDFMKYDSASNWNADTDGKAYQNLKTATQMWYDLFGNSDYVVPNCSDKSNHDAQTNFNNGYAAMMFNGDWMYNEILDYKINNSNFELAVMPTPVATDAVETSITYTIGEDQYIAIPASSSKKELAKEFIKLMISDYGYEVFMNEAHGLLAYRTTETVMSDDAFMNNLVQVKNGYDKAFTNYPRYTVQELENKKITRDTRILYLSDLVDIWGTGALRPYGNILNTGKSINAAFTEIKDQVSGQWNTWKTQAKV